MSPASLVAPGSSAAPGKALSTREKQVLQAITEGLTYAEIARQLGISACTVAVYANRAKEKIGASTVRATAIIAMQRGWLTLPTWGPA